MIKGIDVKDFRRPEHAISSQFFKRWSPRAMSGQDISRDELMSLFEAARWAPSSYNGQPWRFFYALRYSNHWDSFFELLVDFNQQWAKEAAVLIVICSRTTFEHNGKPAPTHSFDTGAAWQNLALQGTHMGLVVHAMQGFDYEKARKVLNLPEEYHVEAMVAVGRPGKLEDLPEKLREREKPSNRKKVEEFVFKGPLTE